MEFPHKLRQFIAWHRRALAAALAGTAVLLLATQLAPTPPPGTDVVVTTRAVSAGDVLQASDVRVVTLEPATLPETDLPGIDDVVGSTAATSMAANSVVQPGQLAVAAQVAPGRALVPVAIADEQLAALLTPGSRVSLVHAGDGFDVVTDDALVTALPAAAEATGLSVGGTRSPLVLVDVPAQIAPTVASLGQHGVLGVILATA